MKFTDQRFVIAFHDLQADAAETNRKNGFSDEDSQLCDLETFLTGLSQPATSYAASFLPLIGKMRNARVGLKLALIMGELGETLEAVRKNIGQDSHCPEFSAETVELADAVIRIMNLATDRNLQLAEAIVAKNRYNRDRKDHSKTSRDAVNGKKF